MSDLKWRHFFVGYVATKNGNKTFGNYRMKVPSTGIVQHQNHIANMIVMDELKDKPDELIILSISELPEADAKTFLGNDF
ncbi:hypothetical protein [uncultured Psychrobacter sp.]|uniref:hypothetical protein n=1 Tax=uncultured Psychrobacter sp. TaxID=259303 RepID=UPI0030DBA42D